MKTRWILLLFSSLCVGRLQAQMYHPFPIDSASWTVDFMTPIPFGTAHIPRNYVMSGDSVVNGVTYSKLYSTSDSAGTIANGPLSALLREQNRVVYALNPCCGFDSGEVALYDFNLNTGDTFFVNALFDTATFEVTTVDSEMVAGSVYRRAINLSATGGFTPFYAPFMRWVEGIGDVVNGPYYFDVPAVDWWALALCFFEKGLRVWPPSTGNCWITGLNETEKEKTSFNYLPSYVIVTFPSDAERKITVMDLSGKPMRFFSTNARQVQIERGNLSSGMYFLKIETSKNALNTYKIVFN